MAVSEWSMMLRQTMKSTFVATIIIRRQITTSDRYFVASSTIQNSIMTAQWSIIGYYFQTNYFTFEVQAVAVLFNLILRINYYLMCSTLYRQTAIAAFVRAASSSFTRRDQSRQHPRTILEASPCPQMIPQISSFLVKNIHFIARLMYLISSGQVMSRAYYPLSLQKLKFATITP